MHKIQKHLLVCMKVLGNGTTAPAVAGLAAGIVLIMLFATAFSFKPAAAKSDSELTAETQGLAEVKSLTSKYPDAQAMVGRYPSGRAEVQYLVERQVCGSDIEDLSSECIGLLSIYVTMKELGHPVVVLSCPGSGSFTVSGDPVKYIESGDCFDSSNNKPKVSVDLPRYTTG